MPVDKLQIQKQDQNRLEEGQKANKKVLDDQLKLITQSSRENLGRIDTSREAKESQITRLLMSPAEKVNIELLSKLASSMAASNIQLSAQNLAAKVATDMEADLNLLNNQLMDTGDIVVRKESVGKQEQASVQTQQQKKDSEDSGKDLSSSSKTISSTKEYVASYAMAIINASPELRKKLERSEKELRDMGVSEKEIKSLQGGVKKSVRGDLSKAVKEAFLRRMLAKDKNIDSVIAAKNLDDTLNSAENTHGAGNAFLGGTKGLAETIKEEARNEAKDFVLEDLELKLIEKILSGQTKELDEHIKSLVILGLKLGVDMVQFMTNWKKKKIDLGLFTIDPRLSTQLGMDGGGEEERESSYDMTKDDEKEIFINRLRALYMIRAMKGDIITKLDTAFKMRKLKNGLIKLGLKMEDFGRLEKEGARIAKFKFMEMLKEALAERATLYDLAGPAFTLIEKKIKSIMSNLVRIGSPMVASEFENLRDTANRSMYDTAISELHGVDAVLDSKKSPFLEAKRGKLVKLIARLRDESKIEGINLDVKKVQLIRHGAEGVKIIQESA